MERRVIEEVNGYRTSDGAGVSLVRVLGHNTVKKYDPILMLDSFDSTNPEDYLAGFPLHPHRGIETVSYVYKGGMRHKDSMGNEDTIVDGEVQWMTAGSGILHEEDLIESKRMLGVQLWLNLPKKNKMCPPFYTAIKNKDIKEIDFNGGKLRLLAGSYKEDKGFISSYLPLDYYHLIMEEGSKITIDTKEDSSILVFTLLGQVKIGDREIKEKTAAKLSEGDKVTIEKIGNGQSHVLFISSKRLNEDVAWGGPIVMNTREELQLAFSELRDGNFIKDKIEY